MKKPKSNIDTVLNSLYTDAKEWSDKLAVAKEMVRLEMARLKASPDEGGDVPAALQD